MLRYAQIWLGDGALPRRKPARNKTMVGLKDICSSEVMAYKFVQRISALRDLLAWEWRGRYFHTILDCSRRGAPHTNIENVARHRRIPTCAYHLQDVTFQVIRFLSLLCYVDFIRFREPGCRDNAVNGRVARHSSSVLDACWYDFRAVLVSKALLGRFWVLFCVVVVCVFWWLWLKNFRFVRGPGSMLEQLWDHVGPRFES
jgi:hypothetical protein